MTRIRVGLADGQPIVREGMRSALEGCSDIEIVGEADSVEQVEQLCENACPDLLVLDLSMPGSDLPEVLRLLRSRRPTPWVLVFSTRFDPSQARWAMRAGARGYLHGSSSITLLRNAIRAVHRGELFCDVNGTHAPAAGQALAPPGHLRLSPREFEVFLMLGGGMRVVEIAAKLGLSPKTVSTHRSRILEKTGLDDNAAIVRYVHTSGLNQ